MTPREKIAAKIRALRQKTVANGCTEAEAKSAAEVVAKLLAEHNLTLEETELHETPFNRFQTVDESAVGERLWKIGGAAAYMTGARYWTSRAGAKPSHDFFGFVHEVEVAQFVFEICQRAMHQDGKKKAQEYGLMRASIQRAKVEAFLDGMADRLSKRIRDLRPADPTGSGLIILRDELVVKGIKDAGINLDDRKMRASRNAEEEYARGVRAADRVQLRPGLRGRAAETIRRIR